LIFLNVGEPQYWRGCALARVLLGERHHRHGRQHVEPGDHTDERPAPLEQPLVHDRPAEEPRDGDHREQDE
jgi:hypothetical protein